MQQAVKDNVQNDRPADSSLDCLSQYCIYGASCCSRSFQTLWEMFPKAHTMFRISVNVCHHFTSPEPSLVSPEQLQCSLKRIQMPELEMVI